MIEIHNLSKTYHLKTGDVEAIKEVDLSIQDGEIYGIIGYSGAGKSSLIRCLNLLETPDRGEIIVNGIRLTQMVEKNGILKLKKIKERKLHIVRRGIGMIFQHFNLLDRSTVYDNIAYPLKYCNYKTKIKMEVFNDYEEKIQKLKTRLKDKKQKEYWMDDVHELTEIKKEIKKNVEVRVFTEIQSRLDEIENKYERLQKDIEGSESESLEERKCKIKKLQRKYRLEQRAAKRLRYNRIQIKEKVIELLDLVDLKDKINVYPSQLSGGQKQRVAIARALANEPKVLLSDEATSALDPDATESILELLKKLNQQLGLTIVLITHEMSVIKSICHRVSVMENGKIVEEGDVYEIFSNPKEKVTQKFVSSTSSLSKIDHMILANSPLIDLSENGKLIQLQFLKNSVGDALISDVSRKFNVNLSIVLANVELLQESPLGGVIAVIKGTDGDVSEALKYIEENQVKVEVIQDGRVY